MSKKHNQTKSKELQSKFDEIQKKDLEILKKRIEIYSSDDDDSNSEIEVDKKRIDTLFGSYKPDENDQTTARIYDFFENGENDDCLICKH